MCDVTDDLFCFLREFLALVGSEKARATNMNCEVVTMVKHDQSEPLVDVTYCECPSNHEKEFCQC